MSVTQVNRSFVCDTVDELTQIRFDNLNGCRAFVKTTPSSEYINVNGSWQLIAGSVVVEAVEAVETDKQDLLVSGTNIKTINGASVLGSGDLTVSATVNAGVIGAVIDGAADATPNDTDLVMSVESATAKKNTWLQLKGFLKTYFDAIYNPIPTGTPDGTKYLRDDNTWQPVSGGSGLAQYQVRQMIRR